MFGNYGKSAVEAYKMRTRTPVVFSSRAAPDFCLTVQAFVNCLLSCYEKLLEWPLALVFTGTMAL